MSFMNGHYHKHISGWASGGGCFSIPCNLKQSRQGAWDERPLAGLIR